MKCCTLFFTLIVFVLISCGDDDKGGQTLENPMRLSSLIEFRGNDSENLMSGMPLCRLDDVYEFRDNGEFYVSLEDTHCAFEQGKYFIGTWEEKDSLNARLFSLYNLGVGGGLHDSMTFQQTVQMFNEREPVLYKIEEFGLEKIRLRKYNDLSSHETDSVFWEATFESF